MQLFWRNELLEMIESRREFLSHANFLSSLGMKIKDSRLYLPCCFESVAKTHIEQLCQKLTQEHANCTPAKIESDSGLYCIITSREACRSFTLRFDDENISSLDDERLLIDLYLNAIDFKCIADEINTQASQLSDAGLGIFAQKIIDQMNLSYLDGWFAPYRKSGRIICHTRSFNYMDSYSKTGELTVLQNAFDVVKQNSGVSFGLTINEYLGAIQNLTWKCEKIPSRTIFGKGGHLEIHCFKDKHEYRFSSQAFDVLMAFLTINGKSDVVDNIMEKTDLMAAA